MNKQKGNIIRVRRAAVSQVRREVDGAQAIESGSVCFFYKQTVRHLVCFEDG